MPDLPTNIDATYNDDPGDPSVKAHQLAHDELHTWANQQPEIAAAVGHTHPDTDIGVNVADHGAVGDGVADDTAAIQAAVDAAEGRPVEFPAGTYRITSAITLPSNAHLDLTPGAVLEHTFAGALLIATGVEDVTKRMLTATADPGTKTVVATGHGLAAGDVFRLGSTLVFDASSTAMTHGELLFVASVEGDIITTTTPVQGGPYTVADSGYVRKVTPARSIAVTGSGTIRGAFTPALGQYGVDVSLAVGVRIDGITIEGIDRQHVHLSDVVDAKVTGCRFDWAVDDTQAYGVSFSDACQDCEAVHNTFLNVRHSLSTNNASAIDGIPRRIRFAFNTVRLTSTAQGGSMAGGDAIDTHSAAEDIWIEGNTVLGSAGQGINFEAPSGRIVGNVIRGCDSHGLSVHNESDQRGRITVHLNDVAGVNGHGIYVRTGARGTTAAYEFADVSHNITRDTAESGVVIGSDATGTPAEEGVIAVGNTATRAAGAYALYAVNVAGMRFENNKGLDGATAVEVTDEAPADAAGVLDATIAAGAVTISTATRYLVVDTEAGAAADDLATINGGSRGQVINVRTAGNSRDVTLTQTGNIRYVSAITLDTTRDSITLAYDGTTWVETARAVFP